VWSSGRLSKEGKGINCLQIFTAKPGRSLVFSLLLLVLLAPPAWGAGGRVEIRTLGLSKVKENTLLTVVLDRPATPLVSCRNVSSGQPQLVVDFPGASAGRLPSHLEGDESLVQQVLTETAPPGGGVRIILDLFPAKPYVYWQQTRPGQAGQTFFILGLKPDPNALPIQEQIVPPAGSESTSGAPAPSEELQESTPAPEPPEAEENEGGYHAPQSHVSPSTFAELRRLMPKAAGLFQGLETSGWVVSEANRYDRPGRRFSRDFILTNARYPELSVKVAYIEANVPNTPNIDIIMLTTDNLQSEAATQYRALRQWSFARIKKKYEDIGDFFDDALKPLRVKLRQETQALTLRDAAVFQNFLKLACPNHPQIAAQVMQHVREKVSPRFEGIEYTISDNPLVFLNLVDFLCVKIFFVGG